MAALYLQNLTKRFGNETVVRDVSLEVRDGEFLVLLGPSGCGKTTLLRLLAGLEEATTGKIFLEEQDITHREPKDRDMAMVFQNYALYPHMTVYENMSFGLKMRKVKNGDIDLRVMEAAELLELSSFLSRYPKELSGGQRQRVALGRAIVRKPKVFLMDEPLSNLDAQLRAQTRAELIKLHKKLCVTTVYVTHDQVEAMTMGGRVAVLNRGALQQVGTPKKIYEEPANRFVGEFIGNPGMNFLKANVEMTHTETFLVFAEQKLCVPQRLKRTLEPFSEVDIGIRPEAVRLEKEDTVSDTGLLADVELMEPLGGETLVHLKLCDMPLVAKIPSMQNFPSADARVCVILNPEKLRFFNPENGMRLKETV